MFTLNSSTVQHRAAAILRAQSQNAATSARRLASGKRLTSAADNVAEVAIATTLNARHRSRLVARRNIAHGRNIAQLAAGGLTTIRDSVVRLREIAVQSASDGLSDKERQLLQKESFGLLRHIDAVAHTTKLDALQPLLFKTPVDIGFVIDNSGSMGGVINLVRQHIGNFTKEMKEAGFNVAFGLAKSGKSNDTDGVDQVADIGDPTFDSELQNLSAGPGGAMDNYAAMANTTFDDRPGNNDPDLFGWRGENRYGILVTDTTGSEPFPAGSIQGDTEASVAAGMAAAGVGFHGIVSVSSHYDDIAAATGGTIQSLSNVELALDKIEADIDEDLDSVAVMDFQVGVDGDGPSQLNSGMSVDATALSLGINSLDVATLGAAQLSLDELDAALDILNEQATAIGSVANRLDFLHENTARTLETEAEGLSHTRDTDIAEASTAFARTQVLSSAATQILKAYSDMRAGVVMRLLNGSDLTR